MSVCWYDECQNADDQQAQPMTTHCTLWIINCTKMLGNAPCDDPILHKFVHKKAAVTLHFCIQEQWKNYKQRRNPDTRSVQLMNRDIISGCGLNAQHCNKME
jgi:hypothetical protein